MKLKSHLSMVAQPELGLNDVSRPKQSQGIAPWVALHPIRHRGSHLPVREKSYVGASHMFSTCLEQSI